ncbi:CAMK protein kinase [Sphaeroforma arctica JP610]|uniref:CAMK protein kinase n=1 Tax=Sphaeroforma arctica JP610 TaxID=667725 RepID=A0A0L0FGL8_9EUKA|nr:CAMK protein kinase [Sphaeroforma arctica JP610]KNC75922.1 CAMK protein kinase [Sphaeroforma arctica JP610]|eukprot:XP_014149824.1 CAMK protein kinase [Sphaeroforma arctica JP610]
MTRKTTLVGSLGLTIPNWSPRSKRLVRKMRKLTLSGKSAKKGRVVSEYTVEEEQIASCLSIRGNRNSFKSSPLVVESADSLEGPLYVEQSRLVEGSTCAVYAAMESATGRRVALKRGDYNANQLQMQHEYEVLQQLSELEHVVTAYDLIIEDADNDIYLVMELCTGGSLVDLIVKTESGYTFEYFKPMIAQLTGAFSRIHELGIVHRDIKADNVCLATKDGGIRVLDFGEALVLKDINPAYFNPRAGTMHYMSPELVDEIFQKRVDVESPADSQLDLKKCDVFALGVTIYCALTACFPWRVAALNDPLYVAWAERGCLGYSPTWRALPYRARVLLTNMLNPDTARRWRMDEAHSFTLTGMMPVSH